MDNRASADTVAPKTPDALIADLTVYKNKRGPFFQTRSRALVDKYFAKPLADLIGKMRARRKVRLG